MRLCATIGFVLVLSQMSSGGLRCAAEPALPDLTGRWCTVQRLVATAELPFLGSVGIRTTVGLFSDVVQSGSCITLFDAYCFTDLDLSTTLLVTDIPDAAMQSVRPDPRSAELRIVDGEVRFIQQWHTEVRGAVLEDPQADPLPTYRGDPRAIDMDGDGQIGFTIPVELVGLFGGDTYAVQRFRYRLEGKYVDPDTIVGTVAWSTEQEVLWATDALLMMPFSQGIDPDPAAHRFVMARIDDTWTCDSIRERTASLLELLDRSEPPGLP